MESALTALVKAICTNPRAASDSEAAELFKTVRGRNDFGPRLTAWLEASKGVFVEPVRPEWVEHPQDHGVDVLLEGQNSQSAVGFQIKSKNDFKQGFVQKVKAQITDARAWKNLDLYVIVLACDSRFHHYYQFLLNESLRYWRPEILVLPPGRAATLWKSCSKALTKADRNLFGQTKTWSGFFADSNKMGREPEFLQTWPTLPPDERFVKPKGFEEILADVSESSLTVLVGPPAVGKTFTAVQLLWRHYKQGRPIRWIDSYGVGLPNHPIPAGIPTRGFEQQIEGLCRTLGIRPARTPLHVHEFITANLESDSLVLIEDPFGAEDEDFGRSLHTYKFFDLNACVSAIAAEALKGCRLILTSRQGLFERWQSEARKGNKPLPEMRLVRLSAESYDVSESPEKRPKFILTEKLFNASRRVPATSTRSELFQFISDNLETPREIELLVGRLSSSPTGEEVSEAIGFHRKGIAAKTRSLCSAQTDWERLFLFLLVALTGAKQDFTASFYMTFKALKLNGKPQSKDSEARLRYWGLFVSLIGPFSVEYLEPAHSTVKEAIQNELRNNGKSFLNRLALALPLAGVRTPKGHLEDKVLQSRILSQLCSMSELLTQKASETVGSYVERLARPHGYDLNNSVLENWSKHHPAIRTGLFAAARDPNSNLVSEICGTLPHLHSFPRKDAWKFYQMLSGHRTCGVVPLMITHPWLYFLLNLKVAPRNLVARFDNLSGSRPDLLAIIMGEMFGMYAKHFPPHWRAAILSPASCSSLPAQEQVLGRVFWWNAEPPPELVPLLQKQLQHSDWRIRAHTTAFILNNKDHLPPTLVSGARRFVKTERNPLGLLELTRHKLDDSKTRIANVLLTNGDKACSAALLNLLLNESNFDTSAQELAKKCLRPGGDYARAALVYAHLNGKHEAWLRSIRFNLPKNLHQESNMVKLAFVWAKINGWKQEANDQDAVSESLIIRLVRSLRGLCSQLAYFNLAYQSAFLSEKLQQFVVTTGDNGNAEARQAVESGRRAASKDHGPEKRVLLAIPLAIFCKGADVSLTTPFPSSPVEHFIVSLPMEMLVSPTALLRSTSQLGET